MENISKEEYENMTEEERLLYSIKNMHEKKTK